MVALHVFYYKGVCVEIAVFVCVCKRKVPQDLLSPVVSQQESPTSAAGGDGGWGRRGGGKVGYGRLLLMKGRGGRRSLAGGLPAAESGAG